MKLLFDSFWRAAAYCLHPWVILLSLLPLVLMVVLALGLFKLFWEPALDAVRYAFESWMLLGTFFMWMDSIGLPGLKAVLAPLVVVFLSTPVLVVVSLLVVSVLMAPALLKLLTRRRFPQLEKRQGGTFAGSLWVSLGSSLLALVALIASIPLWLVPPLVLIVPPMIWGWLTYRVMSYEMLADHASAEERRTLMRRHRATLLTIGVVSGYLGAAPSLVWASGALFLAFAPVLVPIAIWIYTLVFAFSALWFGHYGLSALQVLRSEQAVAAPPPVALLPEVTPEPPLLPLPPF